MAQVARALSDDQVAGELRKMVQFIKQEAMEKSREVQIKADEEFAIEKAKLVRSETVSIDATYDRKAKAAALSQQVAKSNINNKIRLKILGARQQVLDEIFEETREKLGEVEKSKEYPQLLKNLILEGAFAMMDHEISVRVKEADKAKVKDQLKAIQAEYKEQTGRDVEIVIDEKHPLPKDGHGGVVVLGGRGKIELNNTLEERLQLIEDESLPTIRTDIFGPSPNRKFFD